MSSAQPTSSADIGMPPSPAGQGALARLPPAVLDNILECLTPEPLEMSNRQKVNFVQRPYEEDAYPREQWGELRDRRAALSALSRTNKQLSGLALPLLYRRVIFSNRIEYIRLFLITLLRFPNRGQWVHQMCWHLPNPIYERPALADFRSSLVNGSFLSVDWPEFTETQYSGAIACLKHMIQDHFGDFRLSSNLGVIGLPILALALNLQTLTIWGIEPYPAGFHHQVQHHPADADPFLCFLLGFNSPRYQQMLAAMLPNSIFGIEHTAGQPKLTFPPPHLHTILHVGRQNPMSYLVHHVSINSIHSQRQLVMRSEALQNLLAPRADGVLDTSFLSPSVILNSSTVQYLEICEYLDQVAALPIGLDGAVENWKSLIAWLKGLPGRTARKGTAKDMRALNRKYEKFSDTLSLCRKNILDRIPLPINRVFVCALARFLDQMNRPNPANDVWPFLDRPTCTLKLWQPEPVYLDAVTTGVSGDIKMTLKDCILNAENSGTNLKCLEMDVRVYAINRQPLYGDLNPSLFENVRELTITTEALWGPLFTAIGMLEGGESTTQPGYNHDLSAEDHGFVQSSINISSASLWAMKRKAIERLPPRIECLRIVDWFAEYIAPGPDFPPDFEVPPPTPDMDLLTSDDVKNGGHRLDPKATTDCYQYPSGASAQGPNLSTPNPYLDDPRGRTAFTTRYIQALFKEGLGQMSTPQREYQNPGGMLVALRPTLKRLEFIYTLRSKSSAGPMASFTSDQAWRAFAASNYLPRWTAAFQARTGIVFGLYEETVGNVYQGADGGFAAEP
ncbi:hypothetical protein V8F20_003920 [Naviculisporaceae sp. PSN 640]